MSRVQSSRILVRTSLQTVDVVWLSSADSFRSGTPMPADLTGRERRVQISRVVVLGGASEEFGKEDGTDDRFYWHKVVRNILHYAL